MRGGGRHSKKDVEAALVSAEEHDWEIAQTKAGHHWGLARCGKGCSVSIWSTPKSPGNHGEAIRRAVDKCPHTAPGNKEDDADA